MARASEFMPQCFRDVAMGCPQLVLPSTSEPPSHHHGLAIVAAEFPSSHCWNLFGSSALRQRGYHVERTTRHREHHAGDPCRSQQS